MKTIIDFILNLFVSKKMQSANWYNKIDITATKIDEVSASGNPPLTYSSPVKSRYVTSPFGYRNFDGMRQWHNGVDYAGTTNKTAAAPCRCKITKKLDFDGLYPCQWEWSQSTGWKRIKNIPEGRAWTPYVILTALHNDKLRFIYRHGVLMSGYVLGGVVEQNETFYQLGNYGNSAGMHLHWEVEVNDQNVNPEEWLNKNA
jgi:murein DD-endopeptidase MepM/ murein hydrolase activator NlpD